MFGFTLKKWFYDLWDNALLIILINFIFLAGSLIGFVIPLFFPPNLYISLGCGFLSVVFVVLFLSGIAGTVKETSDFEKFKTYRIIPNAIQYWPSTLFLLALTVFAALAVFLSTIYYGIRVQQLWGYLALGIVYWLGLVWMIISGFFLAFRIRQEQGSIVTLKRLFKFFLDNPIFCIGAWLFGLFLLIISTFAAFVVPGPVGVLLWFDSAIRQRMQKYDYLEAHPELKGKKIPWKDIFSEDRGRLGQRTLKNFFQPWK